MSFTAPAFLFFFLPVILILGLVVPRRLRNAMLVAGSLAFYLWDEKLFATLLLASIGMNYAIGLGIGRVTNERVVRLLLVLGIIVNLGLLVACKYAGFIVANVNALLTLASIPPTHLGRIHLPLGVSFFTFQGLSYLIDIYRGEAKPASGPGQVALYLAFFPKVIAGPIVKYKEIAGQFASHAVVREDLAEGIRRFIVGLGKKIVIANAVAVPADRIFALPAGLLTPATAWLGAVCYTLQIYYDFSGYTDMAIGLGRMFGFRLPENFNYPYVSGSIREFWQRWHISLSTWFRDYLYIPLGGNRRGPARTYLNLMIVFLLCGLWHGANWTFIVWGAFQGCFLILERTGLFDRGSPSPHLERGPGGEDGSVRHVFHHAYALLVIVVGWVIFRSDTLTGALRYLGAMAGISSAGATAPGAAFFIGLELLPVIALAVVGCTPVLPALAAVRERTAARRVFGVAGATADLALMGIILVYSTMLIAAGTYSPFIYAQF